MPSRPIAELKEMIGRSVVVVEDFDIEAGKVEEFACAIRNENPVHRDEDAARDRGFETIPAPLTYTRVGRFPRYRRDDLDNWRGFDLGFDPRYSIHGEQEYEFSRPVYVGDTLTGTKTLVDIYQREGERGGSMTFAEFRTEFRDDDDELVVVVRRTRIETEGAIEDDA